MTDTQETGKGATTRPIERSVCLHCGDGIWRTTDGLAPNKAWYHDATTRTFCTPHKPTVAEPVDSPTPQPKIAEDVLCGHIRAELTEKAISFGKRKGHKTPDIHDLYSAAISIISARESASPPPPSPTPRAPESAALKLLGDVMHLWVDGYISKIPRSAAPSEISQNVFNEIEALLGKHGIIVDYCGWRPK